MHQRYTLSSKQKAAAVLIAMGKPRAKQLLKYFKGDELRIMIEAGHALKDLPPTDVEELVREFEKAFVEGSGIVDSRHAIDAIVDGMEPNPSDSGATGQATKASQAPKSPWDLLATVETEKLVARLSGEQPRLVAALMSRLAPEKSAAILEAMDDAVQAPIVAAMMAARDIPAERLDHVGAALVKDFKLDRGPREAGPGQAPGRVAEILNAMDKQASENLMRRVRDTIEPKKLAALEARLFRFDDLVLLDDSARTTVVDGLPSDLVVRALRGTEAPLREAVLTSISPRSRKMIESELSDGGTDTQAQIDDARKSIAQLAMKLAAEGRITLPERG